VADYVYYNNARWYNYATTQFVNRDPILDGPNSYAYCGDNPITYVDPTGTSPATPKPFTVHVDTGKRAPQSGLKQTSIIKAPFPIKINFKGIEPCYGCNLDLETHKSNVPGTQNEGRRTFEEAVSLEFPVGITISLSSEIVFPKKQGGQKPQDGRIQVESHWFITSILSAGAVQYKRVRIYTDTCHFALESIEWPEDTGR